MGVCQTLGNGHDKDDDNNRFRGLKKIPEADAQNSQVENIVSDPFLFSLIVLLLSLRGQRDRREQ